MMQSLILTHLYDIDALSFPDTSCHDIKIFNLLKSFHNIYT